MNPDNLNPIKERDIELQIHNIPKKPYDMVDSSENNGKMGIKDKLKRDEKPFTPIPKKIIFLSSFLLICGIAFFVAGMQQYFESDRVRGIAFLVFGCLMIIPGGYYSFQLYQACQATSPEERDEILSEIPME